jgi:hypothetical protein
VSHRHNYANTHRGVGWATNDTGRDPVYSIRRMIAAKDATHMPQLKGLSAFLNNQGCPALDAQQRKVKSVEAVDWLFGRMNPRPVLTVTTTNCSNGKCCASHAKSGNSSVALWFAPTCIDTATSPYPARYSLSRKWTHIKDVVTYGRQNATNPGLMRMARHQMGDALPLPPLPPRFKVAPTRTYFV